MVNIIALIAVVWVAWYIYRFCRYSSYCFKVEKILAKEGLSPEYIRNFFGVDFHGNNQFQYLLLTLQRKGVTPIQAASIVRQNHDEISKRKKHG